MLDWNVLVSVQQQGYQAARQLLSEYGKVMHTDYLNVLVMWIDDVDAFLETIRRLYDRQAAQLACIGRIIPVSQRFTYQNVEAFESQAREVASHWLAQLAGRHFYVRMHRRGFRGRLSSQEEERFLDEYILEQLQQHGRPAAKVDFAGAERVIAVETLGQQAGMSLWTREQIERYPFLKLK